MLKEKGIYVDGKHYGVEFTGKISFFNHIVNTKGDFWGGGSHKYFFAHTFLPLVEKSYSDLVCQVFWTWQSPIDFK